MTRDRGAAAVWVLAAAVVVMAVAASVIVRSLAVLERHRAEAAADLAALAGAGRIGVGGDPCAAARAVAAENGAGLRLCTTRLDPSGRSGTVRVVVSVSAELPVVGARLATARARAGRLPGDAPAGRGCTPPARAARPLPRRTAPLAARHSVAC